MTRTTLSWNNDRAQIWVRRRMVLMGMLFTIAMSAVLVRVYYLQVVVHKDMERRAVQVDREFTFTPRRGSILDRNGVELAVTVKAPSVFANPKKIKDLDATAEELAPLLGLDVAYLSKRLAPKRSFVWLKRQITPERAELVQALHLPGIGIKPEHKRFYPQGDLAGQVLGFVGIDGNGLEGMERFHESKLAGGKMSVFGQRDVRGRMLLNTESPRFEGFEGQTIQLTLDEHIQRVAQDALATQVKAFGAKGGYAVAIDVHTGEVLALANAPRFNPNKIKEYTSKDWRLASVTDTFEPGSVIKPMVLAAAMEESKVRLSSNFDCEKGRIKIGRYTIRDSHAHEHLTAAQVIQVSSNIGAYKIAQTIGREKLYEYLRAFGFGSRTGIKAPGEQPGLVWPAERWAEVSFANIAFGQGFAATPLQVVSAIAAIANDGMLIKPRLIKSILDKNGAILEERGTQLVRRVVSREHARKVAWAMSLVTTSEGTAPLADMEHFTVAGKTGTAQKVNPKTRHYDPDMWVASFVGFLPAERPRIAIAVMIDEPRGNHYGGVVAAPVFKKIAQGAVTVLGIMPVPQADRFKRGVHKSKKKVATSKKTGKKPKPVLAAMKRPRAGGDGRVVDMAGSLIMPDLRALTMRVALERLRSMGAMPQMKGWGRVVSQIPEPGAPWSADVPITLELLPATRHSLSAKEPSSGSVNASSLH